MQRLTAVGAGGAGTARSARTEARRQFEATDGNPWGGLDNELGLGVTTVMLTGAIETVSPPPHCLLNPW